MAGTGDNPSAPVLGSPIFQFQFQTPSSLEFQQPSHLTTPSSLEFHQPSHLTTPSSFLSRSVDASLAELKSKPSVQRYSNLVLRSLAFVFAFVSAVAFSSVESHNILRFSEFRYSLAASIVAVIYSALQLVKGIRELAFRGFFLSDKASDYATFILDQMVTYLLLSSSSVFALAAERIGRGASKTAIVISVCMSFAAFVVVATSTLVSGYKLCKRIMW